MSRLRTENTALHFQCTGEGEDLVLIHGLGANLAFWYIGIATLLARRYRVITYDLRGHGRSGMPTAGYRLRDMANDLQDLFDYLNVERAHIVGHSFGARVGLLYAIAKPHRVATLTLADTQLSCLQPKMRLRDWPYWTTWKQQLKQQGFRSLPSDENFINFHLLAYFSRISMDFTHSGLAQRPRRLSLKTRDMGRKGGARWRRLLATTSARYDFDDDKQISLHNIKQIGLPTLAVYGEYSHCLPSCWKFKELIHNCQVAIIPGAGHFHPVIKPRVFVRVLGQFLRRHALSPSRPGDREDLFGKKFKDLDEVHD
jgi:pimeloyl-ACP methyl ester carboxylesterase